ncbi:MAG: orotidine 5'-phosphate decarboxylase [Spirochaetales bacterium]|nr:orotidine 5'-phosphate decarboxylase [Spirochaetales bacterium]
MKLQLALDQVSLDQAIRAVDETQGLIDIVEIGTPLVIKEGLAAVSAVKGRFPSLTVVADLKIVDGGAYESRIAFEAGADIVTVLAFAHEVTVREAVGEARKQGGSILVDLLGIRDIPGAVARAEAAGAEYVCIHTASDLAAALRPSLRGLEEAAAAVRGIRMAAAGGITLDRVDQILSLPAALRPEILIVGGAIMKQADRRGAALRFRQRIDQADGEAG